MTEIKQIIDTLDLASDKFSTIADKQQKKMFDEVIVLTKSLEVTSEGKVKQSIANLKRLAQIKAKLAKLAQDDEWVAGIGKFLQIFSVIQNQQTAYFQSHFAEMTLTEQAKKKHQMMKEIAVQNTIDSLTGDGLKASVTDKLNDILLRAVTSGEKFADLQNELRAHLMGVDGGQGALARYAKTYATTAMTQFTGNNNKLLTQDLGLEWYMYVGSNKETTREFCEELTKKQFIHVSEIPTILKGKIDDYQCAIYPKTGLPYGMIEGTNEDNFQCNCGGWNCRHQLVPVAEAAVPANLRAKFADWKKTTEPTPQPIAEEVYKADLDSFKEYLTKHKSGKVADDVAKMYVAAKNGDHDLLSALIADAKATIAKNEASIKSKAGIKGKEKKGELQSAISKYGDCIWFDKTKAKELLSSGSNASIDAFIANIGETVVNLDKEFPNIPDVLEVSKHVPVGEMIILEDKLSDINLKLSSMKDNYDDAIEYLLSSMLNAPYEYAGDVFIKYAQDKLNGVYKKSAEAKIGHVKEYTEAHPKAGKVIDLYNKAIEAINSGEFDIALSNIDQAEVVMKTNESSNASKKAAKQAAKAAKEAAVTGSAYDGLDNIVNADEELKTHTIDELKIVSEQIGKKLNEWNGYPLELKKKKIVFEIDFLKNNMKGVQDKYPTTWKISLNAYQEELKKVEAEIVKQSFKEAVEMHKKWFMENPGCVQAGILLSDIDSITDMANMKKRLDELADVVEDYEEKQINERKYIDGKLFENGSPYEDDEIKKLNKLRIAVERAVKDGESNGTAFENYADYVLSLSKKYNSQQLPAVKDTVAKKAAKQFKKYIAESPSNPNYVWGAPVGGYYSSMSSSVDAYIKNYGLTNVNREELSLIVRFTDGMTFYNAYNLRSTSAYWKKMWESKMAQLSKEQQAQQELIIGEYSDALDGILSKCPRYTGIVYRGLKDMGAVEVLNIIQRAWDNGTRVWTNTAAASSSWQLSTAMGFDSGSNGLILKIHNKTGAYIRDISEYNGEREIMLIRNKSYRILKEPYKLNNRMWVELDEMV